MAEASPKRHLIPACEIRVESKVVSSRFVTTVGPAFTVDEARTVIARVRSEGDSQESQSVV